jgi:hypothetical protein
MKIILRVRLHPDLGPSIGIGAFWENIAGHIGGWERGPDSGLAG